MIEPTPENSLTLQKLQGMMERFRELARPDAFDLYGHDLAEDQCFIIDRKKLTEGLFKDAAKHYPWMAPIRKLFATTDERKTLIVPRLRLEEIYFALRSRGIDVRLEPRYGSQPLTPEDPPCPPPAP